MNTLRTNLVSVLLIIGVLAVTGLNHLTTQTNLEHFQSGALQIHNEMARNKMVHEMHIVAAVKEQQIERLTVVAESEANRAEDKEAEFKDLVQKYVELRHVLNQAGVEIYGLQEILKACSQHIDDCHAALKKAGVEPPPFPAAEQTGPAICPEPPAEQSVLKDKSA